MSTKGGFPPLPLSNSSGSEHFAHTPLPLWWARKHTRYQHPLPDDPMSTLWRAQKHTRYQHPVPDDAASSVIGYLIIDPHDPLLVLLVIYK
jgi:hypothetical protein